VHLAIRLSMPVELVRRAKVLAAQRDMSVPTLVARLLEQPVGDVRDYDEVWEAERRDLREILSVVTAVLFGKPPPNVLPIPGVQSATTSAVRMYKAVGNIYDERKANPTGEQDLLQILVDARLRDGTELRRRDLLYDTIGLMVAGYDTVVAAMCWMLALLPTNLGAQQQLFDEVDALGGGLPGADDLDKLSWAKACFDEGQRLQGGNPFNFRWSKDDNELAGYRIPKGAIVVGSMTTVQRDPRWWANPDRFDPNHFADQEQVKSRPKTAFIPFGTGPHQCVGMAMAYMNAQLLTAMLLQRYRIHRIPGWESRPNATTSTTLKGGFPCTITRRS